MRVLVLLPCWSSEWSGIKLPLRCKFELLLRGEEEKTQNVGRLIPLLEDSNLLRGKPTLWKIEYPKCWSKVQQHQLNVPNPRLKHLFAGYCSLSNEMYFSHIFPMVFPNMKKRLPKKHLRHWAPKQLD